ncbi:alpha/beta hydrolase [soil metagenome]
MTDHRADLDRTIVFLHGAGVTGWMWDAQVADLTKFRCIVIDLPGHGSNHELPWVSIDATAALVAEVIRERTNGTVSLVGLSLGGDVGLRVLAGYPQLIDRAVLTGMVVRPVHGAIRWLQSALAPMAEWRSFHRMAGKTMGLSGARLDEFMATASPMRRADYRAIVGEIFAGVSLAGLETVTVPTLAMAGAKETSIARASAEVIAATMPGATARIVPGVGHIWNVEAPDLFSSTVREWIDAPPTAGGADGRAE